MKSPSSSMFCLKYSRNCGICGFTLIEILTVLAITAVMTSLIVPALTSLSKSNALNVSADVVVNMANLGRETAMSKNAMTALVVLTDPSINNADRVFGLMELDPRSDGSQPQSSDWKQVSKWESINSGVISDPSSLSFNKSTDVAGTAGVPTPTFPPLVYHGKTIGSYSYVIFLPGGNLLSGTSPQIQLVEGNVASGSVTYTRPVAGGGAPANYYILTVLTSTGRVKVDRP
jgi:prepilin-type N-terminal cleavage/methylation domain-containing protein